MTGSTKGSSAATRGSSARSVSPPSASRASRKTTKIQTSALDLKRALAAVLPAAALDSDLFVPLRGVFLGVRDGALLLQTTDRYIAARAMIEADGDLTTTFLDSDDVRLLLAHLRTCGRFETVVLRRRLSKLTVVMSDSEVTFLLQKAESWQSLPDTLWKIFDGEVKGKGSAAEDNDPGRFALSPKLLRQLSKILAVAPRYAETRWHVRHQLKPVLIGVEDWLTVAIMPMRTVTRPIPG